MRKIKERWIEVLFSVAVLVTVAVISIVNWSREETTIIYPLINDNNEEFAIVPVTGNTGFVNLACGSGTVLKLEDGSTVSVPKLEPCEMSISAGDVKESELPANLPADYKFIDATSVNLIYKGESLPTLPENKKLEVSFVDNANLLTKEGFLSVLQWSQNRWKEVAIDSRLKAISNQLGVFVLVKR